MGGPIGKIAGAFFSALFGALVDHWKAKRAEDVLREAGLTWTRPSGTHKYVSLRRDCLDERFPGLLDALLAAAGTSAPQQV